MPILESTDQSTDPQEGPATQFPAEPPPPPGHTPISRIAKAIGEEMPVQQTWRQLTEPFGPASHTAPVPGYDPIPDVPSRHLDRIHDYLHLDSPEEVAQKTRDLDHQDANMGAIARGGPAATAAYMGAGLIDPINVASMAIVPEAAPTRLGNAIRWALTNAAVTGGQELLDSATGSDVHAKDALLNISGAAVLGGVLGPLAPRLPKATVERLGEAAAAEFREPADHGTVRYYRAASKAPESGNSAWFTSSLDDAKGWAEREGGAPIHYVDVPANHPARGGDTTAGIAHPTRVELPAELAGATQPLEKPAGSVFGAPRTVLGDTESLMESVKKQGFEQGIVLPPEEEHPRKQYVPPLPEGATKPRPGFTPDIEPHRMTLTEAIAVSKGAESKSHGLSFDEAVQQGLDPEDLKAARFGSRRVFTKGGMGFDEAAQILHQHGYPVVDEAGNYSPNALLDSLDAELRGTKQYSTHAGDYLQGLEEHARASAEADKALAEEGKTTLAPHETAEEAGGIKRGDFVHVTQEGEEGSARVRSIFRHGPDEPWQARVRHEGGYETSVPAEKLEKMTPDEIQNAREAAAERAAIQQEPAAERGEVWSQKFIDRASAEIDRSIADTQKQLDYIKGVEGKRRGYGAEDIAELEKELEGLQQEKAGMPKAGDLMFPNALPGEPGYAGEMDKLRPEVNEPAAEPMAVNPGEASTAGAQAAGRTLADLTTGRGAELYNKTIGKMGLAGRLMNSPSGAVRRLTSELLNLPGMLEMNYRGIKSPSPVERDLVKQMEGMRAMAMRARKGFWKDYLERARREGVDPMKRRAFMEEIAKSMRRGDKHEVLEVQKAAKWHRENIFDPFYEKAKKLGLLPEEAKLYAESYLTRVYDHAKIRANYDKWIEDLRQGLIRMHGVDPVEAADIAHRVARNIGGGERGMMDWSGMKGIVPKSGRFKGRELAMPDTYLEKWLSNDIDQITGFYLRSMAPEVAMTERFGTRDLKDQFQEINDEYAHLQQQAAGDADRHAMLEVARRHDVTNLMAARDQLYGIYGAPQDASHFAIRAMRFMRQFNVPRMLGGATFKHFPDLANVIQRFGGPQTFAAMAKLASSVEASKLGMREAQRIGAANDMLMNVSAAMLGDYGSHSQFAEQRAMARLNRFFTIASGETPLITLMQGLASVLGNDEIIRQAAKVGAEFKLAAKQGRQPRQVLNKNLSARLASAGLDAEMLARIDAAATEHGKSVNGLKFGMSELWADQGAARAFESAIVRDAHGVTMRPWIGDKPLFMSKEWGKFIFQFKTFELAASRIVGTPMLQGLAHGDMRAVQALAAQFTMATLGYVAYQKATGGKIELDPKKLAVEIMDRTNLLGWTSNLIFPAMYHMGFQDMSRFYDKDPVSALGPSVELGKDLLERRLPGRIEQAIAGNQLPGQQPLAFRRSDVHFIRKMAPANQLWYFRRTMDNMEDAVGDAFDLPGVSNEERRREAEQKAQRK